MKRPRRLGIVTQDPANFGGVLRLAEYIYQRCEAIGLEPALLHYGRFSQHPEIQVSVPNLLRGEINLRPVAKWYSFGAMRACAIGAWFPEWEPNRLRANGQWKHILDAFDGFLLVTGSGHTGLPLADCKKNFAAWVSSTVETDRSARLSRHTMSNLIERLGLHAVQRAEKRTLHAADRVLTVSNDAAVHIEPIAGKALEVWPYPIDTEKFFPNPKASMHRGESNGPYRFLFVGRANDPRKRVDLFLESCAEFHKMCPDHSFEAVIVSGQLDAPSSSQFPIRQISYATKLELIALYRSATAFLLTSEQEGLGIAALEAMACGLPVISTRCGGPEMFIEDGINGFLVDDSAERLANKMAEVALNAERQHELGTEARSTIESRFSERDWNAKFEALLLSL